MRTFEIAAAWAGPLFIVVLVGAFAAMGFIPPIAPSLGAEAIAAYYEEHRTIIRVGATLVMQFSFCMFFWVAAISVQIRRIESPHARLLSYSQMLFGLGANLVFLLMAVGFTVAAFRPERSAELVQLMNDFAWLVLVMPVFPLTFQAVSMGLAALVDQRAEPVFPRWSAYMNFWIGLLFLPGAITTFFKTGPFAWNGFFVFWVPVVAFIVWIFVMAWLVTKAARRDEF